MLKESDFPTIDEIAACLEHIPAQVEPDMREHESEEPCIDVRLQVWDAEDGGGWTAHTGDANPGILGKWVRCGKRYSRDVVGAGRHAS